MASSWQKMMFFLGLVDDEATEAQPAEPEAQQTQAVVRTVEPESRPAVVSADGSPLPATSYRTRGVVAGRRVEPPTTVRRRVSSNPTHAEAGLIVQHGGPQSVIGYGAEAHVIEARVFSDAQEIADHLRRSTAVVLDLRSTEPEMVRRLVDFSSGLTYALDGSMRKIAQGVILVSPAGVVISDDEKARLGELGLMTMVG